MIPVYIVEDDRSQRESLEKIVRNRIVFEEYDMDLKMATDSPDKLLNYLKEFPKSGGLFFLDIDLQHEMNGFDLAVEIRELEPLAKIVFVTSHGELAHLTFKHKIEAMDYIIKEDRDSMINRVGECMKTAQHRHFREKETDENHFLVKTKNYVRAVPLDVIMFFQSSNVPHKVILHTENGRLSFYSTIKEIVDQSEFFYLCHKSYVINLKNVRVIHRETREVEMINGQRCPIAVRKVSALIKMTERE